MAGREGKGRGEGREKKGREDNGEKGRGGEGGEKRGEEEKKLVIGVRVIVEQVRCREWWVQFLVLYIVPQVLLGVMPEYKTRIKS